jgi:hypothetical protein
VIILIIHVACGLSHPGQSVHPASVHALLNGLRNREIYRLDIGRTARVGGPLACDADSPEGAIAYCAPLAVLLHSRNHPGVTALPLHRDISSGIINCCCRYLPKSAERQQAAAGPVSGGFAQQRLAG